MDQTNLPYCTECGKRDWIGIPDSLAMACNGCGAVLVKKLSGGWEPGASIQQWVEDVYGKKK